MPPLSLTITITLLFLFFSPTQSTVKSLYQDCYCDISSSCDSYCCCDSDCSSSSITLWSTYSLCSNDGFSIPFCSSYISSPIHIHDLSQGLRLIYTVIKRLFCISRVNFAKPSQEYQTVSSDLQLPEINEVMGVNQDLVGISAVTTVNKVPFGDNMGVCYGGSLRDMDNVEGEECKVYVQSTATITNNPYLNPSTFCTTTNLAPTQLKVYLSSSNNPSTSTSSTVSSLSTSFACSPTGTTSLCNTILQINLFLIRTSSTTVDVDYNNSYLVIGQRYVNDGSYVRIGYSYQFGKGAGVFNYAGNKGYQMGRPLNLVYQSVVGGITTNYKVFNPVNLAYRKVDGTCRTASTDSSSPINLYTISFGQNSIHSCTGTTNLFSSSLPFTHIGIFGLSSTNEADYIKITNTLSTSTSQNARLMIYYNKIGTQLTPQYQILAASLAQLTTTSSNERKLFIQFEEVRNNVTMNVPSPPVIDAYLPDDFLYPFYVA